MFFDEASWKGGDWNTWDSAKLTDTPSQVIGVLVDILREKEMAIRGVEYKELIFKNPDAIPSYRVRVFINDSIAAGEKQTGFEALKVELVNGIDFGNGIIALADKKHSKGRRGILDFVRDAEQAADAEVSKEQAKARSSYNANLPVGLFMPMNASKEVSNEGSLEVTEDFIQGDDMEIAYFFHITINAVATDLTTTINTTSDFLRALGFEPKTTIPGMDGSWFEIARTTLYRTIRKCRGKVKYNVNEADDSVEPATEFKLFPGRDNDSLFYTAIFDYICSQCKGGATQRANSLDFSTKLLSTDPKYLQFRRMMMVPRSPCRIILSEILPPFLLVLGFRTFDGHPLFNPSNKIGNSYTIDRVQFPDSSSNVLSDFGISIAYGEDSNRQKLQINLSSKFGDKGHMPSIFSLLRKQHERRQGLRAKNDPVSLTEKVQKPKVVLSDKLSYLGAMSKLATNPGLSNEQCANIFCQFFYGKGNVNAGPQTVTPSDWAKVAKELSDNDDFMANVRRRIFSFFMDEKQEFQQVTLRITPVGADGLKFDIKVVSRKRQGNSHKSEVKIYGGDKKAPFGIWLTGDDSASESSMFLQESSKITLTIGQLRRLIAECK